MNTRWIRISHRWIGGLAALWLIVLAVTGLLLQHAEDWGLDKKPVRATWLLRLNGFAPQAWVYPLHSAQNGKTNAFMVVQQFGQSVQRLVLPANNWLDLPEKPVAILRHGANHTGNEYWLVFSNGVWLINRAGEILGQWDSLDGLPAEIEQAWYDDQHKVLWLRSPQQSAAFVFKQHNLQPTETPLLPQASWRGIRQVIASANASSWLSDGVLNWQKVLFAWHAGLLGSWWLNDLSALALIYLGLTGLWLFLRRKPATRNRLSNKKTSE